MDRKIPSLDWLNPLKALALLSILLNHFVEEFGSGPWFTNPSENWPDLATRLSNIFPNDFNFPISVVQFIGWLGDSGPGVFILASGIGLSWSYYHRRKEASVKPINFYKRRLLRIFPLYITMHLVILAGSLFISTSNLSLASPKTLLSMLGLRFTDGLFFYINPSWWFVWLILQLYLIYPLLQRLLDRFGPARFLTLTISLTFLSRFLGLAGIKYSSSLFFWMTGIFCGTRLAEFTLGMAVACLLFKNKKEVRQILNQRKILFISCFVYLIGLSASFTWPGTIISNLLVTAGLALFFFSIWKHLIQKSRFLSKLFIWIGIETYGIYLLHQAPLKWTGKIFAGNFKWHLITASLVMFLTFPLAHLINKMIKYLMLNWRVLFQSQLFRITSYLIPLCFGFSFLVIEQRMQSPGTIRFYALLLGISLLVLALLEYSSADDENWITRLIRWTVAPILFLKLFLFPVLSKATILAGAAIGIVAFIISAISKSRLKAWVYSTLIILMAILFSEWILTTYFPLEAGSWGELPALQKHPTRIYSLKHNQTTRLKYNNYDYLLKTNSFGLPSPEISIERPAFNSMRILVIGDAFSMPEGLEYKHSFPALMEKELSSYAETKKTQVINAGVTGYGPKEQYPQLKELGTLFKPDLVIYQFFINEFMDIHHSEDDLLVSIGLKPRYKSFRMNFTERSQILAHLKLKMSNFKELLTRKSSSWRYSKALITFYENGNKHFYSNSSLQKLTTYLEMMYKLCKELDSQFIIYFVPGAIAVSQTEHISYFPRDLNLSDKTKYDLDRPYNTLKQITDKLHIPLVDLTPPLKNSLKQPVYFPESWHWNKEGHVVVANAIVEDLINREIIQTEKQE